MVARRNTACVAVAVDGIPQICNIFKSTLMTARSKKDFDFENEKLGVHHYDCKKLYLAKLTIISFVSN